MMDIQSMDVSIQMAIILALIGFLLLFISGLCVKKKNSKGYWLPPESNAPKREFEIWALKYTAMWITAFGFVVVAQQYEHFDEWSYMKLCVSLALPFLLQPFLFPLPSEKNLPLWDRYSFKANVWIAIFSFIGNYWYTHYFYSVLKAEYLFPAHRLNDVPIALYFATHFYFVTYHTFSNLILRKIESTYENTTMRSVMFWASVFAFSYFTAFMETLSISSFPYYRFEDRVMAYTLGSAFYGIYFIISFPVFYQLDEYIGKNVRPHTLWQAAIESFGASMIVLCLLDFCRLWCNVPLNIKGVLVYVYRNQNK